jgi:hypothetical protein
MTSTSLKHANSGHYTKEEGKTEKEKKNKCKSLNKERATKQTAKA